jgi:hypothetical protein
VGRSHFVITPPPPVKIYMSAPAHYMHMVEMYFYFKEREILIG